MDQLFLRSGAGGERVRCPPDAITWLDRALLSGNADLTLHRAPRCAGLRYVHHQWELFSRDATHRVYLAPAAGEATPGAPDVRRAARHVLPAAPGRYEAQPVPLGPGSWLVSVGAWVLWLGLEAPARPPGEPAGVPAEQQPPTQDGTVVAATAAARQGNPPRDDAVARVRGYFERNATARTAMAYYYQEFILGLAAPQTMPMMEVVVALDLSGEGAVSDYKKLLQGMIWEERGHARDLVDFLLSAGLLTLDDLEHARRVAASNERRGVQRLARQRLQYRPRD